MSPTDSERCRRCGAAVRAGVCPRCALGDALLDESLSRSADPDPGLRRLGGYEVQGVLGQGGMGVVYRAHDASLGRDVALKVLRDAGRGDARERFLREGRALARLRHPNLVEVHDLGEEGGLTYLVLGLVEGESLAARLARQGPLSPAEAARLTRDLARAVGSAHALRILHRDIKPGNVLFDRDGVPRLTDFGLALAEDADERLSRSGVAMGTPGFLAPEQAIGDRAGVGPATDVYGLGATLYAALTGDPPILVSQPDDLVVRTVAQPPQAPSARVPGGDPDLDAICLRCLEKEPARRYRSAEALAQDLERYLAGGARGGAGRGAWVATALIVAVGVGAALSVVDARAPRAPRAAATTTTLEATPVRESVDEIAQRGLEAAREGRYPEALALFDRVLAFDAELAPVWFNRALVLGKSGDVAGELESYDRCLALAPTYSKALFNRAGLHLEAHRYEASLADVERYLVLEPGDPRGHYTQGMALSGRGHLDEAERALSRALELDPRFGMVYLSRARLRAERGDASGAEADAKQALAFGGDHAERARAILTGLRRRRRDPLGIVRPPRFADANLSPETHQLLRGSLEQVQRGEAEAGLRRLTDAAKSQPDLAEVWLYRGLACASLGRFEEALGDFDRAAVLAPRHPDVLLYRGLALCQSGDPQAGLGDLDEALQLRPDYSWARFARGRSRLEAGDVEGALADMDRVVAEQPKDAIARYHRGLIHARQERVPEALGDFDRVVADAPGYGQAWVARGTLLGVIGRRADAIADLERALTLELEPDLRAQATQRLAQLRERR